MVDTYPPNYVLQNNQAAKQLNVVVAFEGTDQKFSLVPTMKTVAGQLVVDQTILTYLSSESNLQIGQVVEPDQGKASASVMSLVFVDVKGFMTNFVTSGKVFSDIMGGIEVKIYLGYATTSFKDDYFVVFRGYVSGITSLPTKLTLQLTDANLKLRGQVFGLSTSGLAQITQDFTSADITLPSTWAQTGNLWQNDNKVELFADVGGVSPSPLVDGTDYYIVNATPTTFQLSATSGGAPIVLTDTGSGSFTMDLISTGATATVITVSNGADFVQPILGPNGSYDPALATYIVVDSEVMQYGPTGISGNQITVTRGARGTVAADHDIVSGTDLNGAANTIELTGNIIDNSLKIMLGGWDGPWLQNQAIAAFAITGNPDLGTIPSAIVLPAGTDGVQDVGLAIGDYIYTTGSVITANNLTCIVTGFVDNGTTLNNIVIVNKTFTPESPTAAVLATRSQYDTLPANCSNMLRGTDVDVANWQENKLLYLGTAECTFRNYITTANTGKDFIEGEYLLPAGGYSITRFGRLSLAVTKPPIAGTNLVTLNNTNIVNPDKISVTRALNNRRFYNEIQYTFDYDDTGTPQSTLIRLDSDSLTNTQTDSVLPIDASGLRTQYGAPDFINQRVTYLLKRFSTGAIQIAVTVNWKAGSLIETSDIVALVDNGLLQIANLVTGQRNIGAQLWEVIQRTLDIKTGTASLVLLSQNDYQITDRFAGIAPSSMINTGSTTSVIVIEDSYGEEFPFAENKKWIPIIGDQITVRSPDYTTYNETTTLFGFVTGSNYQMIVNPPLPSAPPAGYIVEVAAYPNTTNPVTNQMAKLLFSSIDPSVTIVSGVSNTAFTVSSPDALLFKPGLPVLVHDSTYVTESVEVLVDSIVGNQINLQSSLGFTPTAGQLAELIGFIDSGGPYRIL